MVRVDIFLHAYYTYRDFNHQISGRSDTEENAKRIADENDLFGTFQSFLDIHDKTL